MNKKRLLNTTSPYLQQHADNPVDWYPWCEEALNAAKLQNKPILLSIGYSACHWCHVMAHESFEDQATADLMNQYFINIKVDREERPDLDKIHQTAHMLLTKKSGGWPLTLFLTPDDHCPFFAGTYFPIKGLKGSPAFKDVLDGVHHAWQTRPNDIRQQNLSFHNALIALQPQVIPPSDLDLSPLDQAFTQLCQHYDPKTGGFSQPPKFPYPSNLTRLIHHYYANQQDSDIKNRTQTMLETTLTHMALGGINDQLDGGFYRYSVDDHWEIPHFEKMLYDNAALLSIYADLFQLTGKSIYHQTAHSMATWAIHTMQSASGGFYSSIDADSDGKEGAFYLWDKTEVKALLTDDEFDFVATRFGLYLPPNIDGQWHFHGDPKKYQPTLHPREQQLWHHAKETLCQTRHQRTKPNIDHKILTAWNALMIKGLASAGHILKHPAYQDAADKALAFIQQHLWKEGRLLAVHKDGISHQNAYLDDYVFLIDALLTAISHRWNKQYLAFAIDLTETLLSYFQDRESGGFYFTSSDHEQLIQRPKSYSDEAIPAGNGIAAKVLFKLGYLLGNTDYIHAAQKTLENAWPHITAYPRAHCSLIDALEISQQPLEVIIIRGDPLNLEIWQEILEMNAQPQRYILGIPKDEENLPGALENKIPTANTIAYVCDGMTCRLPIDDIESLDSLDVAL